MQCNGSPQGPCEAGALTCLNERPRVGVRLHLQNKHNKERAMMDVLMLVLALILFAAAIGYTYACERL
jgi:hypothetical protein